MIYVLFDGMSNPLIRLRPLSVTVTVNVTVSVIIVTVTVTDMAQERPDFRNARYVNPVSYVARANDADQPIMTTMLHVLFAGTSHPLYRPRPLRVTLSTSLSPTSSSP
jgi:hypothetical protein